MPNVIYPSWPYLDVLRVMAWQASGWAARVQVEEEYYGSLIHVPSLPASAVKP